MKTLIQKIKSNLSFIFASIFLVHCYGFAFSQANNLYLDESFGEQGKVVLPDDIQHLKEIEFDEQGNILAAGFSTNNSNKHLKILKISENGIIDENFADNGYVEIEVDPSCEIRHLYIKPDNTMFLVTSNIIDSIIKIKSYSFSQNGNLEQEIDCIPSFEFGLDTFNLNAACFRNEHFLIPDKNYVYKLKYSGESFANFGENGRANVREDYELYIHKVLEQDGTNYITVAGSITEYVNTCNTFVKHFFNNGNPMSEFPLTFDMVVEGLQPVTPGIGEKVITMFSIPDYQHIIVGGKTLLSSVTNTFMLNFLGDLLMDVYNGSGEFRNFVALDLPVAFYENTFFIGGKNGEIANFDFNLILNEGFANDGVFTLPADIRYLDIKLQGTDKLLLAGYDNTSGTDKAVLARFGISTNSSADIQSVSSSISIYPNPSNGIFQIESQVFSVEVFDNLGRVILNQNNTNTINLQQFGSGVYYAKILTTANATTNTVKLVVY